MKLRLIIVSIFVVSYFGMCCGNSEAQSAIVNAPSTDVVAAKKLYVEMDFITNYAWQHDDAKFANYLPRAVVGVGHNLEIGANVSYTQVRNGGQPLEIQPNAKWQFYKNEQAGVAAAIGCIAFVPVTHRTQAKTLGQCYSVASKQFSGNHGPRFTGGGYVLIGAGDAERNRSGATVAYEQPLYKKAGLILDWSSGDNRFGYIAPAVTVALPHTSSLTTGYAFANHGRGKNALFI